MLKQVKMEVDTLLKLYYLLNKVRENCDNGCYYQGICDALECEHPLSFLTDGVAISDVRKCLHLFSYITVEWPEYSGWREYPVPVTRDWDDIELEDIKDSAHFVFYDTKGFTLFSKETEYGQLRQDLLDFCVEYIEEELDLT